MVENLQLTRNIWLYDYLKSVTAERFPAIKEQQYNLSPQLVSNAMRLAEEIDQPLLDLWEQPINRTSTYRCPDFIKDGVLHKGLNTIVGGSLNPLSAHCFMRAGDREPQWSGREATGPVYKEFLTMLMLSPIRFDKCILEFGTENCPAWVHLQINDNPHIARRLVYRIGSFTANKYVPFDIGLWKPK